MCCSDDCARLIDRPVLNVPPHNPVGACFGLEPLCEKCPVHFIGPDKRFKLIQLRGAASRTSGI